jgi:signal transduction histidine kinase
MLANSSQTKLDEIKTALKGLEDQPLSEGGRACLQTVNQRLDELVEELRSSEEQSRQAKTKFVTVVTHELRIPMTSIKGYADLLRQGAVGPLSDMQLNFVNVIRSNLERMAALVSDLSDISRIESERLNLEPASFSVNGCIEEALRLYQPKLDEKDQALETAISPDLPYAFADRKRFVQILNILLSNAWRYTPQGGHIRVSAQAEGGAEAVRVEVSDTGIGISPQDQEKLFTQFFRSEAPAVREEQGWGLGLNLARQLVELMGGTIGFQSVLEAGSTFWFTLPTRESTPES